MAKGGVSFILQVCQSGPFGGYAFTYNSASYSLKMIHFDPLVWTQKVKNYSAHFTCNKYCYTIVSQSHCRAEEQKDHQILLKDEQAQLENKSIYYSDLDTKLLLD